MRSRPSLLRLVAAATGTCPPAWVPTLLREHHFIRGAGWHAWAQQQRSHASTTDSSASASMAQPAQRMAPTSPPHDAHAASSGRSSDPTPSSSSQSSRSRSRDAKDSSASRPGAGTCPPRSNTAGIPKNPPGSIDRTRKGIPKPGPAATPAAAGLHGDRSKDEGSSPAGPQKQQGSAASIGLSEAAVAARKSGRAWANGKGGDIPSWLHILIRKRE
jgi:hypothetical protein